VERSPFKRKFRNLFFWLSIIGPGIITANVDNDAGGITTYSLAGTVYGYSLLWTLVPITLALIVVQEMVARMGVVTGKGLAGLIREKFRVKATFYLMIGVLVANLANTVGEFGGVAAAGEVFGIPKFISVNSICNHPLLKRELRSVIINTPGWMWSEAVLQPISSPSLLSLPAQQHYSSIKFRSRRPKRPLLLYDL